MKYIDAYIKEFEEIANGKFAIGFGKSWSYFDLCWRIL